MGGMQDIRQILRCKPALVEEHITRIYIFLSSAVLSQVSKLSMAACQTAQHIFETVKCTTKHVSKYQLRDACTYMKKVIIVII